MLTHSSSPTSYSDEYAQGNMVGPLSGVQPDGVPKADIVLPS